MQLNGSKTNSPTGWMLWIKVQNNIYAQLYSRESEATATFTSLRMHNMNFSAVFPTGNNAENKKQGFLSAV